MTTLEYSRPTNIEMYKVVNWFLDCSTQFEARTALREGCPPELIQEAIEVGRSVKQEWFVE